MIRHVVMLALQPDYSHDALAEILSGLQTLCGDMDGFETFEHGPNRDYEAKSAQFPYGFICTFRSEADLKAYAIDSRHQELGNRLVVLCINGADGIMVIDLEV